MNSYYNNTLYPLQDKVLTIIGQLKTPFYLTGGTALAREYLHHRYSDDLDFFVNQNSKFSHYADLIVQALSNTRNTQIIHKSTSYYSLQIDNTLKLEFVNDVAHHYGKTKKTPLFYKVDNIINILSNKLTAIISRDEPKDIVDVWAIANYTKINWPHIFQDANSKAVGIFPPQIAQKLTTFPTQLLSQIKWTDQQPNSSTFQQDIKRICNSILSPSTQPPPTTPTPTTYI